MERRAIIIIPGRNSSTRVSSGTKLVSPGVLKGFNPQPDPPGSL